MEKNQEITTIAGGCFWCTEAIFKRLKGVTSVVSGYAGGTVEHPSYDEVCTGTTGHAEAIQIIFDPSVISFEKILEVFFATHDPTTLNRQGSDGGTQYRSAIFYHDEKQKEVAVLVKDRIGKSGKYKGPVVTEIAPFTNFYQAEDYHKAYYDKNRSAPYCVAVIDPKVRKLMEEFRGVVKSETENLG